MKFIDAVKCLTLQSMKYDEPLLVSFLSLYYGRIEYIMSYFNQK